jgi:hypothetical protein
MWPRRPHQNERPPPAWVGWLILLLLAIVVGAAIFGPRYEDPPRPPVKVKKPRHWKW